MANALRRYISSVHKFLPLMKVNCTLNVKLMNLVAPVTRFEFAADVGDSLDLCGNLLIYVQ